MIKKKVARRYSLALYETASAMKISDKINTDLLGVIKSIEASRDLKVFLKTPIISPEKKKKVITELYSRKVNKLTLNFIELLIEKKRENYLYDICTDYVNLMNEKNGILVAKIRTAVALTGKDKKKFSEILKNYTGKDISAEYIVDKSIKGGIIAQFSDTIIDASIKRQLEILRKKMGEGSFLRN
jgi:F-type H+-transporting ATPase subunit delta